MRRSFISREGSSARTTPLQSRCPHTPPYSCWQGDWEGSLVERHERDHPDAETAAGLGGAVGGADASPKRRVPEDRDVHPETEEERRRERGRPVEPARQEAALAAGGDGKAASQQEA